MCDKRCRSTFFRVSWPKKENIPRCSIEQVQLTFTRTNDLEILCCERETTCLQGYGILMSIFRS